LTCFDRLFWVALSLLWNGWRAPLVYVRADTVVRWQRERFRRFWRVCRGCPYYLNKGGNMKYHKGMLPQTDALLSRSLNISIGVSDPGLSSSYGVTIRDGTEQVIERANRLRQVALKYLE